jgi:hypothetical protein
MKKALRFIALLCLGVPAFASNTTVTATVTDTDGQAWFGGTFTAVLTTTGGLTGSQQVPTVGGVAVPATVTGILDSSGVLTASLTDTSSLDQTGGFWTITVCPQTSTSPFTPNSCFQAKPKIVGASVSLTGNFSTVPAPRFPSGAMAFGYQDAEVITPASPGATYYNLTSGLRVWNGRAWASVASGGGTIPSTTNLIAGNGSGNGADSTIAPANVATLSGSNSFANDVTVATGTAKRLFSGPQGWTTAAPASGGYGNVVLNNAGTDTPGVVYYYANNSNIGVDLGTFGLTGCGGQMYRWVKNLDETGGSVMACVDLNGNFITAGKVGGTGLVATGTTFSVAGCGTATSLAGGSSAGKFVGGSATCVPVVTLAGVSAPNGFACSMNDFTTAGVIMKQTATTTTTATFAAAAGTIGATDTFNFNCIAY